MSLFKFSIQNPPTINALVVRGPKGEKGDTGIPGPSLITDQTETDLTGILFGDGAKVLSRTADAGRDFLEVYSQSETQAAITAALAAYTPTSNLAPVATSGSASDLLTGTLPNGRLSPQVVRSDFAYPDPSWVTSLAAAKLTGLIDDLRLSSNVPLKNAASNVFTGAMTVGGTVQVGGASGPLLKNLFGAIQAKNSSDTAFTRIDAVEYRVGAFSYSRVAQLGNSGDWGGGYNFNYNSGVANRDSTGPVGGVVYGTSGVVWYAEPSGAPGTISPRMSLSSTKLDIEGNLDVGSITTNGIATVYSGTSTNVSVLSLLKWGNREGFIGQTTGILCLGVSGGLGTYTDSTLQTAAAIQINDAKAVSLFGTLSVTGATTLNSTLGVAGRTRIGSSPGNVYSLEVDGYARARVTTAIANGWLSENSLSLWGAQVAQNGDYEIMQYSPNAGQRRLWVSQAGEVYTQNQLTTASAASGSSLTVRAIASQTGRLFRLLDVNSAEIGYITPNASMVLNGTIQVGGTSGTLLKNSSGTVQVRNSADSAFANLEASIITSAFQTLSSPPSTLDIPAGMARLVKDSSVNEIRHWVNDGGFMKKSPAYV